MARRSQLILVLVAMISALVLASCRGGETATPTAPPATPKAVVTPGAKAKVTVLVPVAPKGGTPAPELKGTVLVPPTQEVPRTAAPKA